MTRWSGPIRPPAAERYKTFPPRWAHVRVPTSSRAAALGALTLYAPCKLGGRLIRDTAWHAVRLGGPRLLPGPTRPWVPPVDPSEWDDLTRQWRSACGPFDTMAVYEQPQSTRGGCALLLMRADRAVAFLKLRIGHAPQLVDSARTLDLLREMPPRSFWVPHPIASGRSTGTRWLALSPLPLHRHDPARRPLLADVVRDIQRALTALPRPDGTPEHWLPMHGDLTPWNLRVSARRQLVLFDWEDAGWGPPGADATYFAAVSSVLWGRTPPATTDEAVAFWRDRMQARSEEEKEDRDAGLSREIDRALASMTRRRRERPS